MRKDPEPGKAGALPLVRAAPSKARGPALVVALIWIKARKAFEKITGKENPDLPEA